ncbi:MAG: HEAT repeat domain-containing protein [Elusimicrobia bacterium]|nr:HEAT repeat domain-containing protein [Elusimicrobiota bacterium]
MRPPGAFAAPLAEAVFPAFGAFAGLLRSAPGVSAASGILTDSLRQAARDASLSRGVAALRDKDASPEACSQAVAGIAKLAKSSPGLDYREAAKALRDAFLDPKRDPATREKAAQTLGMLGLHGFASLDALRTVALSRGPDIPASVRQAAFKAIEALNQAALNAPVPESLLATDGRTTEELVKEIRSLTRSIPNWKTDRLDAGRFRVDAALLARRVKADAAGADAAVAALTELIEDPFRNRMAASNPLSTLSLIKEKQPVHSVLGGAAMSALFDIAPERLLGMARRGLTGTLPLDPARFLGEDGRPGGPLKQMADGTFRIDAPDGSVLVMTPNGDRFMSDARTGSFVHLDVFSATSYDAVSGAFTQTDSAKKVLAHWAPDPVAGGLTGTYHEVKFTLPPGTEPRLEHDGSLRCYRKDAEGRPELSAWFDRKGGVTTRYDAVPGLGVQVNGRDIVLNPAALKAVKEGVFDLGAVPDWAVSERDRKAFQQTVRNLPLGDGAASVTSGGIVYDAREKRFRLQFALSEPEGSDGRQERPERTLYFVEALDPGEARAFQVSPDGKTRILHYSGGFSRMAVEIPDEEHAAAGIGVYRAKERWAKQGDGSWKPVPGSDTGVKDMSPGWFKRNLNWGLEAVAPAAGAISFIPSSIYGSVVGMGDRVIVGAAHGVGLTSEEYFVLNRIRADYSIGQVPLNQASGNSDLGTPDGRLGFFQSRVRDLTPEQGKLLRDHIDREIMKRAERELGPAAFMARMQPISESQRAAYAAGAFGYVNHSSELMAEGAQAYRNGDPLGVVAGYGLGGALLFSQSYVEGRLAGALTEPVKTLAVGGKLYAPLGQTEAVAGRLRVVNGVELAAFSAAPTAQFVDGAQGAIGALLSGKPELVEAPLHQALRSGLGLTGLVQGLWASRKGRAARGKEAEPPAPGRNPDPVDARLARLREEIPDAPVKSEREHAIASTREELGRAASVPDGDVRAQGILENRLERLASLSQNVSGMGGPETRRHIEGNAPAVISLPAGQTVRLDVGQATYAVSRDGAGNIVLKPSSGGEPLVLAKGKPLFIESATDGGASSAEVHLTEAGFEVWPFERGAHKSRGGVFLSGAESVLGTAPGEHNIGHVTGPGGHRFSGGHMTGNRSGAGSETSLVLDSDPFLKKMVEKVKALPDGASEADVLGKVMGLHREIPYMKDPVESKLSRDGKTQRVGDIIEGCGSASCRHYALSIGATLEKLIESGRLEGQVFLGSGEGHAWAFYKARDGSVFVLDPAQSQALINLSEHPLARYSGSRTSPLYLDSLPLGPGAPTP